MARRKKALGEPLTAEVISGIAAANPVVQRLIDDDELRANLRTAVDAGRRSYDRLTSAKSPVKALIEDKKLQAEIHRTLDALSKVTTALVEAPKASRREKRGGGFGKKLVLLAGVGGVAALAISEPLRSKVLDSLFGAEEEFEYSPPPTPVPDASDTPPVSAV